MSGAWQQYDIELFAVSEAVSYPSIPVPQACSIPSEQQRQSVYD